MTEALTFPDIETGLLDWLKATFPQLADPPDGPADLHVGYGTPEAGSRPTLAERGLYVAIEFVGGADDFFNDHPTYSFDVFGPGRQATYDLSEAIRTRLLAAPFVAGGVAIDSVTTRTRPAPAPWSGDGVKRRRATYEFSVRRR